MNDNPFHSRHWPRSIVAPQDYDGSDVLSLDWDLGDLTESEKKKLIKAWIARLPELQHLKRLRLWCRVSQPLFEAACSLKQLQVLQIKWSGIQRLDAIASLPQLTALSLGSSTQVESVEPLSQLSELRVLEIENLKRISDFAPLAKLRKLQSLAVTGSMWSRQTIGSLEPFATMTWLSELYIDTAQVDSLRPLASLTGLRELGLGGRLPYQEYAWLSARLPDTTCRWFAPYYALKDSGIGYCKGCGGDSMVMLTGKGKPSLCLACDKPQVEKHVALFRAAQQAAKLSG